MQLAASNREAAGQHICSSYEVSTDAAAATMEQLDLVHGGSQSLTCLLLSGTLQTVPTCPALYRNTFTYHTVEHAPPDFEECFKFLGEAKTDQQCAACQEASHTVVALQPSVSSGIVANCRHPPQQLHGCSCMFVRHKLHGLCSICDIQLGYTT